MASIEFNAVALCTLNHPKKILMAAPKMKEVNSSKYILFRNNHFAFITDLFSNSLIIKYTEILISDAKKHQTEIR